MYGQPLTEERSIPQLPGFQVGPATLDDLPGVVALLNAASVAAADAPCTMEHWQHRHWYESGLNLRTDTRLVATQTGDLVGYVEIACSSPCVVGEVTGAVHPDYQGRSIGTFLLRWAEKRARERLVEAPQGVRVVLQQSLFETNQAGIALLEANGFGQVRHFVHLRLTMERPPEPPAWPPGVVVRPLQAEDWSKVGPALAEAFRDHWGVLEETGIELDEETPEITLQSGQVEKPVYDDNYFNTPGLCFVAWAGDEVAGSCLCNARALIQPEAGYLGSLSIRRPWRRLGIGLALTLHALAEFYRRGIYTVLTDTDGQSFTGAYNLYIKAGMRVYRRENLYEKEIRVGKDLLKRALKEHL